MPNHIFYHVSGTLICLTPLTPGVAHATAHMQSAGTLMEGVGETEFSY